MGSFPNELRYIPGPDGLNPTFYKRFWHHCGPEIFTAATSWLENDTFPPQINNTNIVLITKNNNPFSIKDFKPISLFNVLYKIISKRLVNCLKPLLSKCIFEKQFAFVEGRSIWDNVMIAYEIVHHIRCNTRRKKYEVALKIDVKPLIKWSGIIFSVLCPKWVSIKSGWIGYNVTFK